MTARRLAGRLEPLLVGLLAGLWFIGGITRTLEFMDEGQIIHSSWRVAHGAVPYVDFHQLYGPSLFVLNGTLFRLVGEDLRVIRLSLVVVKALVVALTHAAMRLVAPRPLALLLSAMLVAAWGTSIWVVNTPYATYYASALCLAAVLVVARRATTGRGILAGLAIGVGATFKQTQGLFALLSLLLFDLSASARPALWGERGAGAFRALVAGAVCATAIVYVRRDALTPSALLIVAPLVVAGAVVAARELRRPTGGRPRFSVALVLGTVVAVAPYVVFYWWRGALAAFLGDTFLRLPRAIRWFAPFPTPTSRAVYLAVVVLASFSIVACAAGAEARRRAPATAASVVALVAGAAALLHTFRRGPSALAWYLAGVGSFGDVLSLLTWLPFVALAAAGVSLARTPDRVAALLVLYAAGATLQLVPAADVAHGLMLLPAILPVVALLLARFARAAAEAGASLRRAGLLVAFAWPLFAMAPFVHERLDVRPAPPSGGGFARATGIWDASPHVSEAAELVRALSALPRGPMLVIDDEPLLYFLADRPSAADHVEYALYLLGAGLLTSGDVRAMIGDEAMVDVLEHSRPLVVDYVDSIASRRFRAALPAVARVIDTRYAVLARAGGYRILSPLPAAQ